MERAAQSSREAARNAARLGESGHASESHPFAPGAVVIVTLGSPREKFWGVLLSITNSTLAVAGVDLRSFDDYVRSLNASEPVAAGIVLFPLHRVERVELDQGTPEMPSLRQRFETSTRRDLLSALGLTESQVRSWIAP